MACAFAYVIFFVYLCTRKGLTGKINNKMFNFTPPPLPILA